tara:strand:+ start:9515 stop:10690 length:1176 start_codon:yes stop_codon:yes gene_type:complete
VEDIEQALARARALHQQGNLPAAETLYRELLPLHPEHPLLLQGFGMLALQSGHMAEAKTHLQRAAVLAPEVADTWLALGQYAETHGEWSAAVSHYNRVLSLAPEALVALRKRAFSLEMDGQVKEAGRAYRQASKIAFKPLDVVAKSPWRNIYHCCTQKTASQWIRQLLGHPYVYQATGMLVQPYVELGLNEAELSRPWPPETIVTHLYVNYEDFRQMPQPGQHKAFFVLRDPRDCVVSWYHSARYSHNSAYPIVWLREQLEKRSIGDGLDFMTDWLSQVGYFRAQRSWVDAKKQGEDFALYRYEDLNRDSRGFIDELFDYLGILLNPEARDTIDQELSFKKLSGGREKSDLDIHSHYRKAEIGDWQKYLTGDRLRHFEQVTGDLSEYLGYA